MDISARILCIQYAKTRRMMADAIFQKLRKDAVNSWIFSIHRPCFIDGFVIKSKAEWTRPIPAKSYSGVLCTTSTSCLANPDGRWWMLHPVTNQLVWFRCCIEWDIHKLTSYDLWYWYWLVNRIQPPSTATIRGLLRVEMREHKKITMSSVQGRIWFEVRYLSKRNCLGCCTLGKIKSNQ